MTFTDIITQAACSSDSRHNMLSDGQRTCSYGELPEILGRLDQFFHTQHLCPDNDTVALECTNSLPGACTLLYLLQHGYRVALLPPRHEKREASAFHGLIPTCCHYRLSFPLRLPLDWEDALEQVLQLEELTRYAPHETLLLPQRRGELYLRTSGSMGNSKLAVHRHEKLLASARNSMEHYQLTCRDRLSVPIPIFHGYGLSTAFLPGIVAGASIDFQEDVNILTYLDRERRFKPTVAFLTPALCQMLVNTPRSSRPYRFAVTSGEKITEELFRAFDARVARLINQYGSTEMGPISACELDDPLEIRTTTIGKPMPGVHVRIDAAEAADEPFQIGELCCQHAFGFGGYMSDEGVSLSRFSETDWFQTGDLAQRQADGRIKVLGRTHNSVNRSGFLVMFSEIERILETITSVERAIVVAVDGEGERGQRIAAFCVPESGSHLNVDHIRAGCVQTLPKYAIPDEIHIIASLPTLPSGKTDRQALMTIGRHTTP